MSGTDTMVTSRGGSRKSRALVIAVVGLAAVALAGYGALVLLGVNPLNSKAIDQSAAVMNQENGDTFYRNPKYGVALRLPGLWFPLQPQPSQYCVVQKDEGEPAAVLSGDYLPLWVNVDAYAARVRKQVESDGTLAMDRQEQLTLQGAPAREMEFRNVALDVPAQIAVLVAKKRTRGYLLVVVGQDLKPDEWQELLGKLPQSLEIR